jgi:tripartite-type tricarboxylate transporter receptor subunit TctC
MKVRSIGPRLGAVSALLFAAHLGSGVTVASAQEDVFKGKQLNFVIRSAAGGGNDLYGRLVARHMVKYIPGSPSAIVTNMPGGGGLVAANYIASRARKDGTEIGVLDRDLAVVQRLGVAAVRFDVRTMIPLGSAASEIYAWVVRPDAGVKSLAELRNGKKPIRMSGTGAGTTAVQQIVLMERDGFAVNVVTGFSGTSEKVLAVLRGDVQGTNGTYESLQTAIREEKLHVFARLGAHPDLKGVPDLRDVLSEKMRPVGVMMAASLEAGRPFYLPPGVPDANVKILRAAFEKALGDPELLKEAERAKQSIDFISGEQVHKGNLEILGSSDEVVSLFKAL